MGAGGAKMAMDGGFLGEALLGEADFFNVSCRIGGPRPETTGTGSTTTAALSAASASRRGLTVRAGAGSPSGGAGLLRFGVDDRLLTRSGAAVPSEGAVAISKNSGAGVTMADGASGRYVPSVHRHSPFSSVTPVGVALSNSDDAASSWA